MPKLKVGIAMSGGVDSTVSASLLQKQGYEVHGFFMLLPLPELEQQIRRVEEIAAQLSAPLHLIDLQDAFSTTVIDYFTTAYRSGRTPNPCIQCNQRIKFGALVKTMLDQGMDKAATGHYARIDIKDNTHFIRRAADPDKDQSYFLARLSSAQLTSLLFPLAQWTKKEVYEKAAALGFHFQGQESQDVCFLNQGLASFLADQGLKEEPGDIVSINGTILGSHRGVWHYTVGQRRGLRLPDKTPWYVVGLDGPANQVIVGKNEDLFHSSLTVHDMQWNIDTPDASWHGHVQLRSRHRPTPAQVKQVAADCWKIEFATPQRAITPGQFAALYQNDVVIASGIINKPQSDTAPPSP